MTFKHEPSPDAIDTQPDRLSAAKEIAPIADKSKRIPEAVDATAKSAPIEQISGPGFVVWLRRHNKGPKLFVTWAETSVIELSPYSRDAWQYPTRNSANDNVRRALGPGIKNYTVRIDRPLLPGPRCSAQTAPRASDDDGGVVGYNTCEFRIKR
jgi:hypothetical protein